jgi:hypothetical protein
MTEIKVSWGLVWAIWWRFALISLGAWFIVWVIMLIVALAIGTSYLPW